jgi:simple sugar transport system ATP-binding protein
VPKGVNRLEHVIEMLNIRKEFGNFVANDNITLQLKQGEIHALLGENGAGKSTLMNVLFGLYQPEGGEIRVRGQEVKITDPNVANNLGIGMVHQHFMLVEDFSVTENIILGSEPTSVGMISVKTAAKKVQELSELYGLDVDPYAKIEDISVGMQQRVEILKTLYRGAEILIFDEPTASLTPQEITELIQIMRRLIEEGKSIILITHKLKEIMDVSDRVTVIRKGQGIGTVVTAETNPNELASLMVVVRGIQNCQRSRNQRQMFST